MIFVSIIIPTFNRCSQLKRALDSINKQTYTEFEIIVVDDGSTDGTAEMLQRNYPQVKTLFQSNGGVSAARNKGLAAAIGNWVAFLDSDDEWLPNKLAVQVNRVLDHSEYHICHTEEIWIRNGIRVNQMKKHKKRGGWIFPHCLPLCIISPSSVLIDRSIFDDVGNFDLSLPACEDYDLWLRITAKFPVLYIEDPQIIKYGGHEDQLSRKYWGMDKYRIHALQKIISGSTLSDLNNKLAINMLIKKCTIFKNGAVKRGKIEEAGYYQQIIEQHISV